LLDIPEANRPTTLAVRVPTYNKTISFKKWEAKYSDAEKKKCTKY